jgi:hypothetical protein
LIPRVYTPPEKHYRPERAPRAWTVAAILLGVAAFVLGFIGFHHERPLWGAAQDGARGFHWSNLLDNLYRTIRLFVFEAERLDVRAVRDLIARADATTAQGYNWYLGIARLLAPAATVAAIVRFAHDYLRSAWRALVARRWRGHVVAIGAGEKGAAAAREIRRALAGRRRLAVIERDAGARALACLQARGAHVVVGDATDEAVLRRAGIARAAHVVIACGGDAANLEVAARVRRAAAATTPPGAPQIHVQLSRLGAGAVEAFRRGAPGAAALVPFDLHALAARRLLDRWPIYDHAAWRGQKRVHAVIAGFGATGRALLLQAAALAWHPLLGAPRFTILDRDPAACRAWLAAEHPALAAFVDIEVVAADPLAIDLIDDPFMAGIAAAAPVTAVFCCLPGIEDNLALGLRLRAAMRREGMWQAPVYYRARNAAEAGMLAADGADAVAFEDVMAPFGLTAEGLSGADILNESADAIARIVHERYAARQPGAAAAGPWEQLDETYRQASRSLADSLRAKLIGGGFHVAGGKAAGPGATVAFSPERAERLAELEHARWCIERATQGWRHGPSRDDARRRHPALVAWPALSEAERAKDRAAIADLPALVEAAGLAPRIRRELVVAAIATGAAPALDPSALRPILDLCAAAPSRLTVLVLDISPAAAPALADIVRALAAALGVDAKKGDRDRLRVLVAAAPGDRARPAIDHVEWAFALPRADAAFVAAYAAERAAALIVAGAPGANGFADAVVAAFAGRPVVRLSP